MSPILLVQNRLLAELPRRTLRSVRAQCEPVALKTGQVLSEPGERIRYVYFPTRSVVSLIAKAAGDATLEVALVGAEGMVGLPLLLGADTKSLLALVQRSGEAWRMKAESFIRMTDSNRTLRRALSKYAFVRLAQVAQNAVCANAHRVEARLARRLLMMQDRSHSDQFPGSQESLARSLGVRRSSVTMVAVEFRRKKLIQYRRGTLTVLDQKGLEKISCECCGQLRAATA